MHQTHKIPAHIVKQVKECAAILTAGGIVAFPTDTVYGMGADVYNAEAVTKVFSAKRRPLNLPLPVLIADMSQLDRLTADIPLPAKALMTRFWPGALTLVFKKSPIFISLVLAGSSKVAVRMPGHAVTLRLIEEAGCPIVGTSANLHNLPALLTASDVRDQFGPEIDFILDGGPCPGGIESTIIDVTADKPVILREGAISEKEILNLLD